MRTDRKACRLYRVTDAFHEDPFVDSFAIEEHENIPGDLYSRVSEYYPHMRQAHVEYRSEQGRWLTTRRKIVWGDNPPNVDAEEICRFLIKAAREHSETEGFDKYQAVLTLLDPGTKKKARKYCPLVIAVNAQGDVEILDDPRTEFSQRDHMEMLHRVIERAEAREDALFQRHLDLIDKMNEAQDRNISMAERQAAGIATIGSSLGSVVNASTKTLSNAVSLFDRKDHETTQVQLAKIDQQGRQGQIAFAMKMLDKLGGPLVKQLSSLFGPENKKKLRPASETSEKTEPTPTPTPTPTETTPSSEETGPLGKRLAAWRDKLSADQRERLAEILGAFGEIHFKALSEANADDEAQAALQALKKACKDLEDTGEDGELELATRLVALGEILGDELAQEFGELLPDD